MTWLRLVVLVCLAEVLTMAGFSTFATLLPVYKSAWAMSNTEAGWVSSAYFAGLAIVSPVLLTLTDRVDSRTVYIWSALVAGAANLMFAFLADGVVVAALLRAIAGAGLAGTYMPGLKALCDRTDPHLHSRITAWYTACFLLGSAISFPLTQIVYAYSGAAAAFALAGCASIVAAAIVFRVMKPEPVSPDQGPARHLLDFRPVFRNRSAMAYTLCYAVHCWELFGFLGWMVAFLVFAGGVPGSVLGPTAVAALVSLLCVPVMILANETAIRHGRARTVVVIMASSALVSVAVGFAAEVSYGLAAAACFVYGATTIAESSVVTAGAVSSAAPGQRGATMAVHSSFGFGAAIFGPLCFGIALDLAGETTVTGWAIAFAHLGGVALLGPLFIALLRPVPLRGDRDFAQ